MNIKSVYNKQQFIVIQPIIIQLILLRSNTYGNLPEKAISLIIRSMIIQPKIQSYDDL